MPGFLRIRLRFRVWKEAYPTTLLTFAPIVIWFPAIHLTDKEARGQAWIIFAVALPVARPRAGLRRLARIGPHVGLAQAPFRIGFGQPGRPARCRPPRTFV